jgi:hypothetical protein
VVHSSTQDQRRQQHLARELQASYATLEAMVRAAVQQEYCWLADAEAAAAKLRALPSAYHGVEVEIEEHPKYGPGRPSPKHPRVGKALWDGLQVTGKRVRRACHTLAQGTGFPLAYAELLFMKYPG